MARYSTGQILGKLAEIKAQLARGMTRAAACKAAQTSLATYTRWTALYESTPLPSFVRPRLGPGRMFVLFSADGKRLLLCGSTGSQVELWVLDSATGEPLQKLSTEGPGEAHSFCAVPAANIDREGQRALVLLSDGSLLAWDLRQGVLHRQTPDLRSRGPLDASCSSGCRWWSHAAVSPDLSLVAYWEVAKQDDRHATLCLFRVADGVDVFRHTIADVGTLSPLVFHPTEPILACLDAGKLVTLIDTAKHQFLLQRGPLVHSLSFAGRDTLLVDDWHGQSQEFNYRTGALRPVAFAWGAEASLSDRFVTAGSAGLKVRSLASLSETASIPIPDIELALLSQDGTRLAICSDVLGVWELPPPGQPAQ